MSGNSGGLIAGWLLGYFVDKSLEQPKIKGYQKTTEFKARGGAWFIIILSIALLATIAFTLIKQPFIEYDSSNFWIIIILVLGTIIIYLSPLFFIFLLRHGISMLQARIVVGPKMLVLDGALQKTPKKKWWHWLYTSDVWYWLYTSDLVVEIPWNDVFRIEVSYGIYTPFLLYIETKSHDRYIMPLGYFSTKVIKEICKYHKIEADYS
jgi:hypothetical protein